MTYSILEGADSFFFKGNEIGILVSHGFGGTPQSMRHIGEKLAESGFTVLGIRLKGHGTHYKDLERCRYEDWIHSFREGYAKLSQYCRRIYIIGQSMGGTLALTIASTQLPVSGVITINAAFCVPEYETYRLTTTPRYIPESAPDIKDPSIQELVYSKVPVTSIQELLRLIDYAKKRLSSIHCPVLLLHSDEDHVVPASSAQDLLKQIGSIYKTMIPLHNSYHVASMDYDKNNIVRYCKLFIEQKQCNVLTS